VTVEKPKTPSLKKSRNITVVPVSDVFARKKRVLSLGKCDEEGPSRTGYHKGSKLDRRVGKGRPNAGQKKTRFHTPRSGPRERG